MIRITMQDGINIPRIHCDSCGAPIEEARHAAAVFRNFMQQGEDSEVEMVHKNYASPGCLRQAEEKIRSAGGTPGWEELREHLALVMGNSSC